MSQSQGVETASQIRYVTYYEKLLSMPNKKPDIVTMKLNKIQITGKMVAVRLRPMSVIYDIVLIIRSDLHLITKSINRQGFPWYIFYYTMYVLSLSL